MYQLWEGFPFILMLCQSSGSLKRKLNFFWVRLTHPLSNKRPWTISITSLNWNFIRLIALWKNVLTKCLSYETISYKNNQLTALSSTFFWTSQKRIFLFIVYGQIVLIWIKLRKKLKSLIWLYSRKSFDKFYPKTLLIETI